MRGSQLIINDLCNSCIRLINAVIRLLSVFPVLLTSPTAHARTTPYILALQTFNMFESAVPIARLTEIPTFAEVESIMAQEENKAVISNFVEEVINQGQLERADDLVAVDFVELDPLPGQQQGREGLKQLINAFRTAFPDIHWVIDEMVGEGE